MRGPVIPPDPDVVLHPTMASYLTALRAADEEGLRAVRPDRGVPRLRGTGAETASGRMMAALS